MSSVPYVFFGGLRWHPDFHKLMHSEDKRKRQRQERAERKEAEKATAATWTLAAVCSDALAQVRRAEELKRLKNLKKQVVQPVSGTSTHRSQAAWQEIKRRLQQIQEVTGNEDISAIVCRTCLGCFSIGPS